MHHRAGLNGYAGDPAWANLGQGSPEVNELPGAPRIDAITVNPSMQIQRCPATSPCAKRLPTSLQHPTTGKSSQYSYENVSIAGGGRLALTRIAAALGEHQHGPFFARLHRLCEELLTAFKGRSYHSNFQSEKFTKYRRSRCNEKFCAWIDGGTHQQSVQPDRQVIEGEELRRWIEIAQHELGTFILTNFTPTIFTAAARMNRQKIVSGSLHRRCGARSGDYCRWSDKTGAIWLAHQLDIGAKVGHRHDASARVFRWWRQSSVPAWALGCYSTWMWRCRKRRLFRRRFVPAEIHTLNGWRPWAFQPKRHLKGSFYVWASSPACPNQSATVSNFPPKV